MTRPRPRDYANAAAAREARIVGQVTETLGTQYPDVATGRLLGIVVRAAQRLQTAAVTLDSAASADDYLRALTRPALDLLAIEGATGRAEHPRARAAAVDALEDAG